MVEEHANAVASATVPLQPTAKRPGLRNPTREGGLLEGRSVDALNRPVHNQGGFDQPAEVGVQVACQAPCGTQAQGPASAKLFELIVPRTKHVEGFGAQHPTRGAVARRHDVPNVAEGDVLDVQRRGLDGIPKPMV